MELINYLEVVLNIVKCRRDACALAHLLDRFITFNMFKTRFAIKQFESFRGQISVIVNTISDKPFEKRNR